MAELLFIATTIFVAYVLFTVTGGKKDKSTPPQPESKPSAAPHPAPTVTASPVSVSKAASKAAPKSKPKTKSTPSKAASVAATPAVESDSLKNPKTGEVAKVPANYAFAKRWIKDALVEEGLLDKIYKNNELDDATNAKIQAALQQLKALAKYQ